MKNAQQLENTTLVVNCPECSHNFEVNIQVVVEHNEADVEVDVLK